MTGQRKKKNYYENLNPVASYYRNDVTVSHNSIKEIAVLTLAVLVLTIKQNFKTLLFEF